MTNSFYKTTLTRSSFEFVRNIHISAMCKHITLVRSQSPSCRRAYVVSGSDEINNDIAALPFPYEELITWPLSSHLWRDYHPFYFFALYSRRICYTHRAWPVLPPRLY